MIHVMGTVRLGDVVRAFAPQSSDRVTIVGIDGPSGSGKSSLARRLVNRTDATLVEIDDFVSWADFSGWWPRFTDQVVQPLLRGEDAHYQVRDWQHDPHGSSLGGWKTAPWTPLVIFDGVTSTRRAVSDLLAYRIWVEAPEDIRLARGIKRDGEVARHLWLAWMQEEQIFFTKDGTRERADLLVNGAASSGVVIDEDVIQTLGQS
jgi:uridine kinase